MADEFDTDNLDDRALFAGENTLNYLEERNHLLKGIPYKVVRRAWFTLSHILLHDGAKIIDMGCGDGMMTYAMAALNPNVRFIGVDKSRKIIREATKTYQLHNLEFKMGDASGDAFEADSVDGIINSFMLHQVFSEARYNEQIISDTLRKQLSILKNDGIMFIRDYAKPANNEFVLLEMHDDESEGETLAELSEADLLVWYSEHARPKQDPGCGGFFLEELPPRFPRTRLFRLPYKWAYEFIMRKDNREIWEEHLPFEYTFYTVPEFRHALSNLGARVEYSAPHWNEEYIREHFEGHFRLLKMDGEVIGDPATSFIAVARKQPERASLSVHERRITQDEGGILTVKTLRDQKEGDLIDVVSRDKELAEIVPYRIADDGRLYIYLHDGVIRGITNAVMRSGNNIDGRSWSGHMLETIHTDYERIRDLGEFTHDNTKEFVSKNIGLKVSDKAVFEEGNSYYPDPNYIDERVHTYYVSITDIQKRIQPKRAVLETHRFREKGLIHEYSAQQVLDAITIGLIPNARLELQILSLMQHLNLKAENWIRKDVTVAAGEILDEKSFKIREFLRQAAANNDKRFKEVKGSAGQLRTINSIFVEEGHSQGGQTGISSEHVDFVVSDEKTVNTAVVLPLTASMKKELNAGFQAKQMPVPQRFEGKGASVSAPQFNIPKEIKTHRMLKQFLAEKFGVTPEMVIRLGESYFSHIGITPQRIHTFAIIAPPEKFKDPNTRFMPVYQYMLLWKSISKEQHLMTTIARAYRYMPDYMRHEARREARIMLEEIFKTAQPDWSLPDSVVPTHGGRNKKDRDEKGDKDGAHTSQGQNATADSKEILSPDAAHKLRSKKKKDKKKKRKTGLAAKTSGDGMSEADTEYDADNHDRERRETDPDLEDRIDIDIVDNFGREVKELKNIEKDIENDIKNNPKPEKW